MAKRRKIQIPEYGQLVKVMQTETANIINDYIRQYINIAGSTAEPGSGIFINFDRVLMRQVWQEYAWYDLYAEVERDAHVRSALDSAKLNVAGMPFSINAFLNPGEKKPSSRNQEVADFVEENFDECGYFPQHLFNLMGALGMGFAVSEIVWKVDDGIRIDRILNRTQRRFQFDSVDRSLRLRNIEQPYFGIQLPPKKFIVHRCSDQWENPFGDALDQTLYWMWLFKKTVLKFWMQHLEVGASSIPIVKHPTGANEDLKAEALSIAEMIRSGAYGRIPANFEVIFAEAKNAIQNAEAYQMFIRTVDDQISKCINGQTLTAEAGGTKGTGTQALGKVHQQTQSARDLYRAHGLAETINAQLIKWLVDFNYADVDGYPEFRFDLEDPKDMVEESTVVKNLSDAGFDFNEEELSTKFNYTITKKGKVAVSEPTDEPGAEPIAGIA